LRRPRPTQGCSAVKKQNKLSHWKSNKGFKEKFGSHTRKNFNRLTNKDSCPGNVTHNTDSNAVCNLKPEQWGSPLVQENYQEEKACDKRQK